MVSSTNFHYPFCIILTPFCALDHIQKLKLPVPPEGGVKGPVGFKSDRQISPRLPDPEMYDSAFDMPLTAPITDPIEDEKKIVKQCEAPCYPGETN